MLVLSRHLRHHDRSPKEAACYRFPSSLQEQQSKDLGCPTSSFRIDRGSVTERHTTMKPKAERIRPIDVPQEVIDMLCKAHGIEL